MAEGSAVFCTPGKLPTPSKAPKEAKPTKEAKAPRVPKYVRVLWDAVKGVSPHAQFKMLWAQWIARLLKSWKNREDDIKVCRKFGANSEPLKHKAAMLSHFVKAESLSCMGMCLTKSELQWLNDVTHGLLRGDVNVELLHAALEKCRAEIRAIKGES